MLRLGVRCDFFSQCCVRFRETSLTIGEMRVVVNARRVVDIKKLISKTTDSHRRLRREIGCISKYSGRLMTLIASIIKELPLLQKVWGSRGMKMAWEQQQLNLPNALKGYILLYVTRYLILRVPYPVLQNGIVSATTDHACGREERQGIYVTNTQ